MERIERMDEFFASRIDGYDEHMLTEVEGCAEGYALMARLLPPDTRRLLDLGCGTGLELDAILTLYPDMQVTGVDLTRPMLDELRRKHPDSSLDLVCADYFEYDFGKRAYDAAVSFQSLHHFTEQRKHDLYARVCDSLKPGGIYLECDYMVETPEEQQAAFERRDILVLQPDAPDGYYHIDTPCCIDRQINLMLFAGFASVRLVSRQGNTTMIEARKE